MIGRFIHAAIFACSIVSFTEGADAPVKNNVAKIPTTNTTRIVGGTWAKRGAYPYQVAIFIDDVFTCGGTLLESQQHVLTAAHCLFPFKKTLEPASLTLFLRTTVLNPPDANYIERNATKFVKHPDYNGTSFLNDVGVITLSEPVPGIRPVRLESVASLNKTYVGTEATVVGWGRTKQVLNPAVSSGPASNNLRHVNVTMLNQKDCEILYYDDDLLIDGKRLCSSTLFGKSLCQGDSGGPLILDGVQIGINSAAAGCADPRFPALYIRTGAYIDWIQSAMGRGPLFKPA